MLLSEELRGGGAGASTALAGDAFNRQLHPNEIKLITGELAAKYAAEHPGLSERDAEAILINQSLRQVDDAWAGKLGPDDNEAKQWLAKNTPDWAKQNGYFSATQTERADPTIYGQYYDKAFHDHTTLETIKADLKAGLLGDDGDPSVHGGMVTRDGYGDMANDLRDQGTMEYLQRKAASGQGLTTQEAQTYAHLATLYPLLRLGALGPYGQLGVALRDQDGAAALAAVIGAVPGEGVAANAGKTLDVAADAGKAFRTMSAAEAESFVAGRAAELQAQLPAASQGRVTMGVGVVTDTNGNQLIVVSTSEPRGYLRPGVTLNPGEIVIPGTGHAEADIVAWANQNGYSVQTVGAGRPICASCASSLNDVNATPATPLKRTK